jgi:hypothetical protein
MNYRTAAYRLAMFKIGRLLETLAEWLDRLAGAAYWETREPGEE